MYIEIFLIAIVIIFILVYNNTISTKQFNSENKGYFTSLKEKDYEFLLRTKYGDNVIDPDAVFMGRIRNGVLTTILLICVFITNINATYILVAIVVGFLVFKSQYFDLKKFYKNHLGQIDSLLPYYLKSLEILVQHYTVPVALARSIEDAPEVFKPGLEKLVKRIEEGDSSIDPYMDFALEYPVRDSMRMMRLLYRLGLGEQDKKHEQMLSFSKTVSSLQNKAREQRYKQRLDAMENQTMIMLVSTGGGALLLMLIAAFSMIG